MAREQQYSFNLLDEPWIGVERMDGSRHTASVAEVMLAAHELRGFRDPSPIYVASLQRFLAAVAQDALDVTEISQLAQLLRHGQFPSRQIEGFVQRYHDRFDLFSNTAPFLQSADLDHVPSKGERVKPIGYLAPELPTATEINHFRHIYDVDQRLCPACVALGLVAIPAFATSGGAGIRPSINGVPPLYVLPAGASLFESLASSIVVPTYQPEVASSDDAPWWRRAACVVERSSERLDVGYLDSLTFPARRVRVHPGGPGRCVRCGKDHDILVRSMVFDMGESRPKDAALWTDPFVAYRRRNTNKPPFPVRPVEGRAIWREFSTLFLKETERGHQLRPRVLDQIDALVHSKVLPSSQRRTFRCVGIRTDMKAKVFEWTESSFQVPLSMLDDPEAAALLRRCIEFTETIEAIARSVFREHFGKPRKKSERFRPIRDRMTDAYWRALSQPFRQLVLSTAETEGRDELFEDWLQQVLAVGRGEFDKAAEAVGDDGTALRQRAEATSEFVRRSAGLRKKYLNSLHAS